MAENIKTKKEKVSKKSSGVVLEKKPSKKKDKKPEVKVEKVFAVKKKRPVAKKSEVSEKKEVARNLSSGKKKSEKVEQKTVEGGSVKQEYFLRWTATDFVRTVGEEYLYRASLILSVLIVFWSLWQMNFFTALSFTILIAVVAFELKSKPREVEYEVNLEGVMIDGRLLRFSDMRSFDVFEKAGFNIVRLQMKTAIFPMKEVFLEEGQDLVYAKTLFEYFLPEEKQEDKLFNFKEKKELTEDEYLDKVVDDYIKGKF